MHKLNIGGKVFEMRQVESSIIGKNARTGNDLIETICPFCGRKSVSDAKTYCKGGRRCSCGSTLSGKPYTLNNINSLWASSPKPI